MAGSLGWAARGWVPPGVGRQATPTTNPEHTNRQTKRHTDRQTNRSNRKKDRQTEIWDNYNNYRPWIIAWKPLLNLIKPYKHL